VRPGTHKRLSNWAVGLIVVVLIAIGTAWAFTKQLPWSDAYSVQTIFPSAQNLRTGSPVRIAGVEVGKVTQVEHLDPEAQEAVTEVDQSEEGAVASQDEALADPAAAIVTMEIEEAGRPIKTDATFRLLPRLFLEGNLFVDIKPGSPSAPEAEEDYVFPVDQASNSVQLDQILTTLQSDVREQLQITLEEFGSALVDHGGAEGFRELYRSSPGANKFTSQVNEAFLGENPHDLSNLIRNLDRVLRGLGRNERALQELITNFRIFAGSFAAEDEALEQAIVELPRVMDAADPAFAALNRAFPPLRAFAREALPGTRTTPEALDAATPLLRQVRLLMRKRELRGLVHDLDPTVEHLAEVAEGSPKTFSLVRRFASCFNEVIIPWQNSTVDPPPSYPHQPVGRVYEETAYGLVGIAGESRSGDANGQYIRTNGAGGTNTIFAPDPESTGQLVGMTAFPILNAMPAVNGQAKPRHNPHAPCERQEPPNLGSPFGGAPTQTDSGSTSLPLPLRKQVDEFDQLVTQLGEAEEALDDQPSPRARRTQATALEEYLEFTEDYPDEVRDALGVERP
jgi:phospholipid/cholesterol/gamma-HCH transport system substrate-binding protein